MPYQGFSIRKTTFITLNSTYPNLIQSASPMSKKKQIIIIIVMQKSCAHILKMLYNDIESNFQWSIYEMAIL